MLEAALAQGAKLTPRNIAGLLNLPYYGNVFYVDPTAGSDANNSGTSPDKALATVAAAYDKCTTDSHDVVIIAPTGSTGRTSETTAIAWSKRKVHLIGAAAPTKQDARAGLGFGTGGSLTISGTGGIFKNFTLTSSADIDVTVELTGDYNYFEGVDFKGNTNATSINSTPWRALSMTGAEENTFKNCTIGSDTMTRSAANANLEFSTACARNVFEDCFFPMFTDDAGAFFLIADAAADMDRWTHFKNCIFHNAIKSSSTTITAGMSIHAAVGGSIILDGCAILGATDWSSDYTAVVGCNMPDITAANAGFMETVAT